METFEITDKDAGGRIGKLRTRSGELETPAFFPVLNPHLPVISPQDLREVGFNTLITNAYSIYQDHKLRKRISKEGLHNAYDDWAGFTATDSGAFQLWRYKDFEVSNLEICEFQEEIGTDIGVILDVPFGKGSKDRKRRAIRKTARRAKEIVDAGLLGGDTIFMGPLHGVPHPDLLELSMEKMTDIPFRMFAVGSIVPLMKNYKYPQLIKSLLFIKRHISPHYPLHLFGAGHPIALGLLTLLGFDTFDSASYAKFAKKDRYLTSQGSYKLKKLRYLPCECPVCSSWSPKELKRLDEQKRRHYLALHNLYVLKREMKLIKQAIRAGRLWRLVAKRVESHPKLAKAYKWLLEERENIEYLETMDPVYKKRGLFITRQEELQRPQLMRYKRRIRKRGYFWADKAIVTDRRGALEIPDRINAQVFIIDAAFGIIPREIREVYPLFQHESFTEELPQENVSFITEFLDILRKQGIRDFFYHNIEVEPLKKHFKRKGVKEYAGRDLGILDEKTTLRHKLKAILRYQYGSGGAKAIEHPFVRRSNKTGRIREIYEREITEEERSGIIKRVIENREDRSASTGEVKRTVENRGGWLLATVVPHHYKIVPHPLLAWRFTKLLDGRYFVRVDEEAEPFIRGGKSVFAKFVTQASKAIRANDEVILFSDEGEFIGIGRAALGGNEMLAFNRGVAVENRWGCPEE